jgi:peptidoglycan/xylan/chitin deacetylase (PgdA/CDA1 family)
MRRIFRSGRGSATLTQLLAGLIGLPLSALPFVVYGTYTPEGRLVRDRVAVAINPPSLPTLTPSVMESARAKAPKYEGGVVALVYHGIGSATDAEGKFAISSKRFAEHLAYLKAAGMHTVTARQLAASLSGGKPLPPDAVMISFDDGRNDAMLFADPLLKDAGMSATMFVITDAASRPGTYYASWDRIEAYARSGRWDIESHTASSHVQQRVGGKLLPVLTSRAPGESLDEYRARVRDDLARASAEIEDHVGKKPVAFAYPFGAYGADRTNDPAVRGLLRQEVAQQYAIGFHQDEQDSIPLLTSSQDPLGLRRLSIGDWSGAQLLGRIRQIAGGPAPAEPGHTTTGTSTPAAGVIAALTGGSRPATSGPGSATVPSPAAVLITPGAAVPGGGPSSLDTPIVGGVSLPTVGGTAGIPPVTTAPLPPSTAPPATSPPATTPPTTVAPPPVTAPPTTPPPTPPTTVAPPPTTPPTTVAPSCNVPSNGKGPKSCPPGHLG